MSTELKVFLFGAEARSFDDLLRPRRSGEPLAQDPAAPSLPFPHQLWRTSTAVIPR